MRNFKSLIAVILTVMMIMTLSLVSFAADLGASTYEYKLVASSSEVTAGSEFTVSVYLLDTKDNSAKITFNDGMMLQAGVRFTKGIVYDSEKTAVYSPATSKDVSYSDGYFTAMIDYDTATVEYDTTSPLFTFYFTAGSEATTYNFTVGDEGTGDYSGAEASISSETGCDVVVKAGSTDIIIDQEDFTSVTDDSVTSADVTSGDVKVNGTVIATMEEGGKIHTYFNKNTAGKTLEAEKYGIEATINGKTFRFPGKTDVAADKAWAIKLVIPNGKFADGVAANVTGINVYTIEAN